MKRMRLKKQKTKKADAILCGDIHLREDTPVCRTDDFLKAQWNKLSFLAVLQRKHDNCPVYCSGDLFHKAIPSLWLVAQTMLYLPENFYTVYGQHDMPNHNMKLKEKSGVYLLEMAQAISVFQGVNWGETPTLPSFEAKGKRGIAWHVMTYQSESPYGEAKVSRARSLLYKYPQFDLILTGDNHTPFVEKYKGRILVNPGSMMRQEASQINYKPAVWLWYADTNTVEPVYLPIEEGVITREHLEVLEQRENRISAFIETLDKKGMNFVNFEQNLNIFMNKNRVRRPVKDLIYQLLENE